MLNIINGCEQMLNKLDYNLSVLNEQFNEIKRAASSSSIHSSELHAKIKKLSENILKIENSQSFRQLDKTNFLQSINKFSEIKSEFETFKSGLPIYFKAEEKRTIFQRIKSATFGTLINTLNRPIRKRIFTVPAKRKRDKKLPRHLNQLKQKQNSIFLKIWKFQELASKAKPESRRKRRLDTKTTRLLEKHSLIRGQIVSLSNIISANDLLRQSGDRMRLSVKTLGSERVTITTPDNVHLDGVFLDALVFRKKLAEVGCKHVTIQTNNDPNQKHMNAIYLSQENYEKSGKEIIEALNELHAFANPSPEEEASPGAGWQIIHEGSNILLVRASELPSFVNNALESPPFVIYNQELKRWETKQEQTGWTLTEHQPIDTESPASGTLILTSGTDGVYEIHKTEALFYLLRNMNVMLFNFRGHGASEGDPTEEGLKIDLESAYQYAKTRSKHKDHQIMFKALCFSSSTAAYVASKHPSTHILIDQTYSSFKRLVYDYSKKLTEKWLDKLTKNRISVKFRNRISNVAGAAASIFAPRVNTAINLAKIDGKKAIFYTHEDTIMGIGNVKDNIEAVTKAGKRDSLHVISAPGTHGVIMTNIVASKSTIPQKEFKELNTEIFDLTGIKDELLYEIEKYKNLQLEEQEIKLQQLEKELENIRLRMKEIEKAIDLWEKKIPIGQNLIDSFLEQTGLAKHLIEPSFQQYQ